MDRTDNKPKGLLLGTQQSSDYDEVIMFCGNPGVGKSSLLNSIFQKNVFASGVSCEMDATQQAQGYIYINKKYIDTPGLSDVRLQEQVVLSIEEALKENKNCKIVFVATLKSGKINPNDLATINKVCAAIKTDFNYGLIFNKVSKGVFELIENNRQELETYLKPLERKPTELIIIKNDANIQDKTDQYLPVYSENWTALMGFFDNLKPNMVATVPEIEVTNYEKKFEELEEELEVGDEINETIRKGMIIGHKVRTIIGAVGGFIEEIVTFGVVVGTGIPIGSQVGPVMGSVIGQSLGRELGSKLVAEKLIALKQKKTSQENHSHTEKI